MKDFKFLPKFAELMATPPPAPDALAAEQPTTSAARSFGFGAAGANRAWTTPTERPLPSDWLRRPRS
jgi:hypothetical protein